MSPFTYLRSLALLCLLSSAAIAQVGIGNTSPNALLDIAASSVTEPASTDGLLIPRIDDFPSVDPSHSQDGMLVFLTQPSGTYKKGFHYWDDVPKKWIAYGGEWNDGNVAQYRSDFSDDLVFARQASSNGADVVVLDSGHMGIGTSTPEESLELKFQGDNDIQVTSVSPPNAPNLIFFTTSGTDFNSRDFLTDDDDIGYVTGKGWTGTAKSADIANMKMIADGDHTAGSFPTKIQFSTTSVGETTDSTDGMEMTIRSTGDVGIGTEDPTQKLDVNGDVRIRNLTEGAVVSDTNGNLSIGPTIVAAGKVAGTGTAVKITGATVSKASAGVYNVTFTTPRTHANYIIQLTLIRCLGCGAADDSFTAYYTNQTAAGFTVHTGFSDNGATAIVATDSEFMFTTIDF